MRLASAALITLHPPAWPSAAVAPAIIMRGSSSSVSPSAAGPVRRRGDWLRLPRPTALSTLVQQRHGTDADATRCTEQDELFMEAALREAELAFDEGEVPIGAVLVRDGAVVAAAHNRVEGLQDASAHAELLCARAAAAAVQPVPSWRLNASTLYCTVEPCPMCLAALHAFRIERLVYGTTNPRLGAVESAMRGDAMHPYHSLSVTGGVLAEQAAGLMKHFFQRRREQGPRFDTKRLVAVTPPGSAEVHAEVRGQDTKAAAVVEDTADLW